MGLKPKPWSLLVPKSPATGKTCSPYPHSELPVTVSSLVLGPPDCELQNPTISNHVHSPHPTPALIISCGTSAVASSLASKLLPLPPAVFLPLSHQRETVQTCASHIPLIRTLYGSHFTQSQTEVLTMEDSLWPTSPPPSVSITSPILSLKTLFSVAKPTPSMFLRPSELILAPGPSYLLFYLLEMLFPQILCGSLSHFFFDSTQMLPPQRASLDLLQVCIIFSLLYCVWYLSSPAIMLYIYFL